MKRIVFPTDFSETANEARKFVSKVAVKFDAEVFICHCVPNILIDPEHERFAGASVFPSIDEVTTTLNEFNMDYRLQEKLEAEIAFFQESGVKASGYAAFGSVSEKVNAMVEEFDCDMIILGTNGTTGLNEEFMGSNAFQVCQWAKVPVITVRECKDLEGKRILVASDFKKEEANKVIGLAKVFSKVFNSKIELLFVNTPAHFVESDDLNEMVDKVKRENEILDSQLIVYNSIYLENGVLNVISRISDLGLVFFGNHGYSRIKRKVEYSIADHLISRSQVPVVSIKI